MNLLFTESAWKDYVWFQENDRRLLKRINELIRETKRTPFSGIGKPEPLKANLRGCWSRRVNSEHRLVYKVAEDVVTIISCRFHYKK
jgi:toxin YoeB